MENATCEGKPVIPSPKQLAFMLLPQDEALYGGAAGGGKSVALLMDAVRYCHLPNWSALIIRKHLTDLVQEGAILDIAHEWLDPWKPYGVKFRAGASTTGPPYAFHFPSGAILAFGYWSDLNSYQRYQGARYNYVGVDEITQFAQADTWMYHPFYLMSRMRRAEGSLLPIKFRAATNPGGPGHRLIKERYGIHASVITDPRDGQKKKAFIGKYKERPFLSAKLVDNLGLDQVSYLRQLSKLDKITRNQLLHGDWDVAADGRFKAEWFPEYKFQGDYLVFSPPSSPSELDVDGKKIGGDGFYAPVERTKLTVHRNQLTIFTTVDPAASVREGVAGATFYERRPPSSSVAATWATPTGPGIPQGLLFLLHVLCVQVEIPELFQLLKAVARKYRPQYMAVETNGPGIGPYQMLCRLGIPCKPLKTLYDKVSNSIAASVLAEAGRIYLPSTTHYAESEIPWLGKWKDEVYFWTGHPHEDDDQIDTLSNAAHEVAGIAMDGLSLTPGTDALPSYLDSSLGVLDLGDHNPILPKTVGVDSLPSYR